MIMRCWSGVVDLFACLYFIIDNFIVVWQIVCSFVPVERRACCQDVICVVRAKMLLSNIIAYISNDMS